VVLVPFVLPNQPIARANMPSLLRFLAIVGMLAGLIYAGIFALATFVKPQPREITQTIPPDKFFKQR
jgi:hypothetical protein